MPNAFLLNPACREPAASQTGGARFDSANKHLYFLASNIVTLSIGPAGRHPYLLVALNEIYTPADEQTLLDWVQQYDTKLLLDSGVFNLAVSHAQKTGISLNQAFGAQPESVEGFDALFEKYVSTVKRMETHLWGYIEIDFGGADGKRETRARLESLGLSPIPVYHPLNDPPEYFDELASRYDRLCVGNLAKASSSTRKGLMATLFERARAYPHLWIHLLGLTPNEWFNAYPFASCDSSGWMCGLRWTDSDRDRAMLKTCGSMGRDFAYVRGSPTNGPKGHSKANALAAYRAAMNLRNWRAHMGALNDVFSE